MSLLKRKLNASLHCFAETLTLLERETEGVHQGLAVSEGCIDRVAEMS
jgi:hypothetical protein